MVDVHIQDLINKEYDTRDDCANAQRFATTRCYDRPSHILFDLLLIRDCIYSKAQRSRIGDVG